jgi:hypothetical protein
MSSGKINWLERARIKSARSEQKTNYDGGIVFPESTLAEAVTTLVIGQEGFNFSEAIIEHGGQILTKEEAIELYHSPEFPR